MSESPSYILANDGIQYATEDGHEVLYRRVVAGTPPNDFNAFAVKIVVPWTYQDGPVTNKAGQQLVEQAVIPLVGATTFDEALALIHAALTEHTPKLTKQMRDKVSQTRQQSLSQVISTGSGIDPRQLRR